MNLGQFALGALLRLLPWAAVILVWYLIPTLGLVNPFLALIPLVDLGPGKDSDCGQLLATAKSGPTGEKLLNK